MTKFLKIIKILQESLIRNSSSKTYQQLSKCSPSSVEGDSFLKRQKYRRDFIYKIPKWCQGSNLETSFLLQIPLTLTISRGLSSRYMIPPKMILKTGPKKTNEVDRLTIIPTWMKKTKIKRFQDNLDNAKNKNQNKNLQGLNISGPKFKMTNLINKKSKTMQLMTESLKQKNFYKSVLNKIAIPLFETKHLVLKKKNLKKGLHECQSGLEDSIKEVINANIPANYKSTISRCNNTVKNTNEQAGESQLLVYVKDSPGPLETSENNTEKSFIVVSENKPKQFNKYDDRSQIRRYKTKNVIPDKDEKLLKLKAKHFEKPEVDLFIKKLAAKYGKTAVQKNVRPRRVYENNRQRVKYDLDTAHYLINVRNADPTTNHMTRKIETRTLHQSKKKLSDLIKKDIENSRILKKENNLQVNQKTIPHKIDEKPKKGTILRKEYLTADKKLKTGAQLVNKKANSTIKMTSKNGLLKDRNKHVMLDEKMKNKLETDKTSNSASVKDDIKGKEFTHGAEIKIDQNKKEIVKDQLVSNNRKHTCSPLNISNSENNKLQKGIIASNDRNYESSKKLKKLIECKKTDVKKQILPNNQSSNIDQLMISDTLSNKKNEFPAKIENMVGESKYKDTKDQSTETKEDQSTGPPQKTNKEKYHVAPKSDTSSKPTEQMNYMKYTPDSPNHICSPKQQVNSCKYKMSRGVHRDKHTSRESRRLLRNGQPDFKLKNKITSNIRSDNSKITSTEATAIDINKGSPSKVEFGNIVDKTLSVPMKIYKFHCHSESLDYKVYKYDFSPLISLPTKPTDSTKPDIDNMETGNLEQLENHKRGEQQCFESQKNQIDVKNEKSTNINTDRTMVNLKSNELTKEKEALITAKQSENNSFLTKRENLPPIPYRSHDSEIQTFDSENQSKLKSEEPKQMKEQNAIHLEKVEEERSHIKEENKNINVNNLHVSNIFITDKEKSNCADTKPMQTIKLEEQIKVENFGANYGAGERTANDKKIFLPQVARKMYGTEEYNIDYSRRELKKILPFLKNLNNNTKNICSKEDTNLEPIVNKAEQTEKEKELILGKGTTLSIKCDTNRDSSLEIPAEKKNMSFISPTKNESGLNNKHYNPNILGATYSEGQFKNVGLKSSATQNPKCGVQKYKQLQETNLENQIEPKYLSSQQVAEISQESGRTVENKMYKSNIEKHISDNKSKTGMNVLYYEETTYKLKEGLEVEYQTVITELQTKQNTIQTDQKSKSWIGTFHEQIIDRRILNNRVKEHVFLKHSFNKEPFLKVFEDIHHVTSGMNIFSRHIPMFAINTTTPEGKIPKKKINQLLVLENDLKNMLYHHLDLYNRVIKHKRPETIKQNENLKIYDLFDSTFILQCFNKTSLNCETSKNLLGVNLCQSSTSLNDYNMNTTENICDKTVPMQDENKKDVSNIIKQIKSCGSIIVKQNPKDISIFELLDCRIPLKCIKSTVKESNTDDKGSQMFNLINSKHMCFYSKYRKNCMGQNVIMNQKNAVAKKKTERKNTNVVIKTDIKQDSSNKAKNLEFIPKGSSQEIPTNMNIASFQEIYKYNHRRNPELGTKRNPEKESSYVKQEEKSINPYAQTCSELKISHPFSAKENPTRDKIEPEVLHYMKKFDVLSTNNDLTKQSNNTNFQDKNTNEAIFKTEKSFCSNESNEYSPNKIKNVLNHDSDGKIKSDNLSLKQISYATDIKFLEKNTEDVSNVISECRRGTFEYLTKVVKKHKTDDQNLNNLSQSKKFENIAKSQEVLSSRNHRYLDNVKKSSTQPSKLVSPNLQIMTNKEISKSRSNVVTATNFVSNEVLKASNNKNLICNHVNSQMFDVPKNDTELSMTSPNLKAVSLKKHKEDEHKSGINSKQNEVISSEVAENSINKLKVMQNVKELEKQLFRLRNLEKTNPQTKNEESNLTRDTNQIARRNIKTEPNNMLKKADIPIQNELVSSVNKESMNKKRPHNNINHVHKNETELGSKIGLMAGMNNVKPAENSFKGMCMKIEDLKKSNNIIKTISTNIQNYNNSVRSRKTKHLESDDIRNSDNSSKALCKVHTVLNKKYTSRIQNGVNKESNILSTRDEVHNLTKTLNFQNRLRYLDKIAEKDKIIEVTLEEQKEGEKVNASEVTKPKTTDNKNSDQITNINTKVDADVIEGCKPVGNEQNEVKPTTNNKINIGNANESHITESIPTGLRCIRQHKIEADKDNGMEKYYSKKPISRAESIKLRDNKRKRIKSPLRKEIDKLVISVKPTLTADCGTTSNLNNCLLKHKKQIETITNDKRVKSIKNKLSNNLKPKDENITMGKQSHTLMSFMNTECVKKKSEDNKRGPKKGKEDGLYSQKRGINTPQTKEQTGSTMNKTGMVSETRHFSDPKYFLESKSNPKQILADANKPSFNIIFSENKSKRINEHKEDLFSKAENEELNFTGEANVKKEKDKKTNDTGSTSSLHCLKKNMKIYPKNKYRENPSYILKAQPKVEGFISQSLRPSNSERSPSSKMYTGVVKKRQAGHLMKNRIKSELKQSAASLKKNISKHRILKTDPRFKNDQKKNQSNLKLAQSNKIFSQKGSPLHNFEKDQKKASKNYLLDTPSRQVCGLTPPRSTPKEKPLVSKAKVTTKLVACTQQKDDIDKQNFKIEKNYGDDIFFISKIHSIKPEKEYKTTLTDLCQMGKEDNSAQNINEYQFDKSEGGILKDENKDQDTNLVGMKYLISGIQQIDQNKTSTGLTVKVPDGNDLSNRQLIPSSKSDIGLPTIVGNVVNNVKTRIQNFLLADIAKSKLNKGFIFKKREQEEIDDLKEKNSIAKTREINRLARLNQGTKQILCSSLSSYANGATKQLQPIKKLDKTKRKFKTKSRGASHRRKTISDLLRFKHVRNKQTCPQMSYSEVLNKFYAGCET